MFSGKKKVSVKGSKQLADDKRRIGKKARVIVREALKGSSLVKL